jgi:hypothetical protein
MGILGDIVVAVPIGIIYNMTVHKTGEIFNNDINYKDKLQRNLLLSFGGGILGLVLASILFNKGKYKNRAIRFGLYIGSALLLFHSIGYNWSTMENDTKFVIMLVTLAALMWYTYSSLGDVNINTEKDDNKTDDYDEDMNYSNASKYLPATYTSYRVSSEPFRGDDDFDEIVNY